MDFQNRSQNLEASLERHRSVSRACFDQRHEFKKDLPRIDFGPVQRGGYLITGLGTLLNAPVFSASGAICSRLPRISPYSPAQAHAYRSLIMDLSPHQSYPLSPRTFLDTNSWLYLFSAVYEAFSDPCHFQPKGASFHSWHKNWIENVFIFRQSQFLLLSVSVPCAARRLHKMYSTTALLASALALAATATHAATHEHWWNITYSAANPDGVSRSSFFQLVWQALFF